MVTLRKLPLAAVFLCFWWGLCLLLGGGRSFEAWAFLSLSLWGFALLKGTGYFLVTKSSLSPSSAVSLWLLWALWLLISVFGSVEPLNSLWSVWKQLTFLVFFLLAIKSFNDNEGSKRLWLAMVFAAATVACGAVFVQLWQGGGLLSGLLSPNKNYTACILAAAAAGLFSISAEKDLPIGSRILCLAQSIIFVAAIMVMNARGAIMAAFATCIFILLSRHYRRTLMFFVPCVLLAFLALWPGCLEYFLKISDIYSFQRLNIWKTAVKVAAEFPFLGVGAGCFERGYFLHNFPVFNGFSFYSHFADHAHSEFLNLAAEIGWIGAILFTAAFWKSCRSIGDTASSRAGRAMAVVLFVEALVDGIFMLPVIPLLFFASLACAGSAAGLKPARMPIRGAGMLLAAGLLIGSVVTFLRHSSLQLFECGFKNRNTAAKKSCLERALKLFPAEHSLLAETAKANLLSTPGQPARALMFMKKAISWNPTSALYHAETGELYSIAGDWLSVKKSMLKAVSLEPNFLSARMHLAEAYIKSGEFKNAANQIHSIDRIRKTFSGRSPGSYYEKLLLKMNRDKYLKLKKAIQP